MKKGVLIGIILTILFMTGCKKETSKIEIECVDQIEIFSSVDFKVKDDGVLMGKNRYLITLSDYNVIEIVNNKLYAKAIGKSIINVVDVDNPSRTCTKEITVNNLTVKDIEVNCKDEILVGKRMLLSVNVIPSLITSEVTFESSNDDILTINNQGLIKAVSEGEADVIITCDDFVKKFHITVLGEPNIIELYNDRELSVNDFVIFEFNTDSKVNATTKDTDKIILDDYSLLAIDSGEATVEFTSATNPNVKGTHTFWIKKAESATDATKEELEVINKIINEFTLDEKIGQMFSVEFDYIEGGRWHDSTKDVLDPTTGLPYARFADDSSLSVKDFLEDYPIGNFTVNMRSAKNQSTMALAVQTLNKMAKDKTGVAPLINYNVSTNSSSAGFVNMNYNGYIKAMNSANINNITSAFAKQMKYYGINMVTNNYLNYENYDQNIYSKDISEANYISSNVMNAYKKNDIIMVPAAFSYDDVSQSSIEDINNSLLYLLQNSINQGAQIISLPITNYESLNGSIAQNNKLIQKHIRDNMNYNGVIMLDSLSNTYLNDYYNYSSYSNMIIGMIINGVDMFCNKLLFTGSGRWEVTKCQRSNRMVLDIFHAIKNAVTNNKISIERINEAVSRILLVKLRNGLMEDKVIEKIDINAQMETINSYRSNYITVIGDWKPVEITQSILVISEDGDVTNTSKSFGDAIQKYWDTNKTKINQKCHVGTLDPGTILDKARDVDYVYIICSNVTPSKKIGSGGQSNFIDFIKSIKEVNKNVCLIIPLEYDSSYEYLKNDFETAMFLYGYLENDFKTLIELIYGNGTPNNQRIIIE